MFRRYDKEAKIVTPCDCSKLNYYYMMPIKALLGVRQTTANDISLLEIGLPPLKHWVKQKQLNFLKQALHHREGLDDDALTFAISLNTLQHGCISHVFWTKRHTSSLACSGCEKLSALPLSLSRLLIMNHDLSVHKVYGQTDPIVPECVEDNVRSPRPI